MRFLGCLLLTIVLTEVALARSLDQFLIDGKEVTDVCEIIEGEHADSIQPAVQFKMAGEGRAGIEIYGNPKKKQFQSFSCHGIKTTVYYYEYASKEDLEKHLPMIKDILWGDIGPTVMHPELILDMDNVLVVISSREPEFFANLLAHRISFPDLADSVVDERLRGLGCGSKKEALAELCSALRDFRNGVMPEALLEKEALLYGHSWEVSAEGHPVHPMFEALYVGQLPDSGLVASFGGARPENALEQAQLMRQIEAQATGGTTDASEPLLAFIRTAFGNTRARVQKTGARSLAFIGMGSRVYLRRFGSHVILMTDFMDHTRNPPFIVATFNMKQASASAGR